MLWRPTPLMSRGGNMIGLQLCCFHLEDKKKKKKVVVKQEKMRRPRPERGAEPLGLVMLS